MILGKYGNDPYGLGPYGGSVGSAFGLVSAQSLSFTLVRVEFSDDLDPTYAPNLDPTNYILTPGLVVNSVTQISPKVVLLSTANQSGPAYTLFVPTARAVDGRMIDPDLREFTFSSFGVSAVYAAIATSATRVRLVFSSVMLDDAELVDPTNYVITGIDGTPVTVDTVAKEQATNPSSLILTLGTLLETQKFYQVTVDSDVKRANGTTILPPTVTFQYLAAVTRLSIPISAFSGEVHGDLYGPHNGLVFFSPALQNIAANSIIQVDEIDVCTRAYDEYHPPVLVDPQPLYTHGAGIVPLENPGVLNSAVLWAAFPRLVEATITLGSPGTGSVYEDTATQPFDSHCIVEIQEPWDPSLVSLLNDTAWKLFDNTSSTTPPVFITAANLTPIPPGSGMMTIVLQPPP